MLTAHGVTHTGLVRKINEDSVFWDIDVGVFMVADGMGGHNAGEVASGLAVETIKAFVLRSQHADDCTWPYGLDPRMSLNGNRIMTAIKLANRRIFKASEARDAYTGMGTTTVAAIIEDANVALSSVGDSRIYSFRNGSLQQLTRDDSWVARVLAHEPSMTPEALATNPMRHVLTNVVGAREQTEVEVSEFQLADGDTLLFSSDGLHGLVEDGAMRSILAGPGDVPTIAQQLVQAALDNGGRDNVTALVVRYTA